MVATTPKSAANYQLHGLQVRSEIPLSARLSRDLVPDVTVVWGERRPVPNEAPDGTVIARFFWANGVGYTHTQTEAGYTLRFHGRCEFQIDRELRFVIVHLPPSGDPEFAGILLAGNVLAFILTLRGDCVLHASAVELSGQALAFVGRSGSGKSTLAALCCAGGAKLITDDLLRLKLTTERIGCFQSTAELRLRPGSSALAEHFPRGATRATVDDRLAILLDSGSASEMNLRAIVIPRPDRHCQTLRMERLSATRALFFLASYPRVAGWQPEELIRRHFTQLAAVARTVAIYETLIPWGPPFGADLAAQLGRGAELGTEMKAALA
jgi:hypothetical protein